MYIDSINEYSGELRTYINIDPSNSQQTAQLSVKLSREYRT